MARPRVLADPVVVARVEGWLAEGWAPVRIRRELAAGDPPVVVSEDSLRRFARRFERFGSGVYVAARDRPVPRAAVGVVFDVGDDFDEPPGISRY